MSCGIAYKGKFYSLHEFRDYVQGNMKEFEELLGNDLTDLESGDYTFKAVQTLINPKIQHLFDRVFHSNKEIFFEKINKSVSKAQLDLIKHLTENKNYTSSVDLAMDYVLNYGFTIELNTAKKPVFNSSYKEGAYFVLGDYTYEAIIDGTEVKYVKMDETDTENEYVAPSRYIDISKEEFEDAARKRGFNVTQTSENTEHYKNLSVPGGVNYTENNIETPSIMPAVKGHGQFSTNNSIGWFRSDDKQDRINLTQEDFDKYKEERERTGVADIPTFGMQNTKTRRILEIQSDLFQKSRIKNTLITNDEIKSLESFFDLIDGSTDQDEFNSRSSKIKEIERRLEALPENKFLQLLIKNNNWAKFFVKAIVQDSFKKGYEKVLFPTGKTTSLIQKHAIADDFIKSREELIEDREKVLDNIFNHRNFRYDGAYIDFDKRSIGDVNYKTQFHGTITNIADKVKRELSQYRRELKEAQEEGTKFPAIAKFYEETIQNILTKNDYHPSLVTDEYGHTWFEVGLDKFSGRPIVLDSPLSPEQVEKEIRTLYKPLTLFTMVDGTQVLDQNMLPTQGPKIAEKIKAKYGWESLKGVVYFDRKTSSQGRGFTILRIDQQELAKRLNPPEQLFDSGLLGLAEAMKEASQTQEKFEKHLDRIGQEADKISKIINKVDDEGVRTRLRDAVKFVKDPIKRADAKNFSYLVFETSETLKYYADRIKKLQSFPVGEQISEIDRAKVLADNFADLLTFLKKEFRFVDNDNEFKVLINDMGKYSDQIQDIYSAEAEELAIQGLSEYLEEDQKIALEKLKGQLETLRQQREKAVQAGASEKFVKRIDQKIEDVKKDIIKFVPDKETLDETFRGLRGDLNWITANLRSTIAMGDPVISGFSRKLKEGYNRIRRSLMPIRDLVYDQLVQYKTALGKTNNQSMSTFYEGLYDLQDLSRPDFDGKLNTEKYYTLLSPFKESFYNEDIAYKQKIRELKEAGEDSRQIEKDYRNWLSKYAQRRYKDAWYERYDLLIPEAEKPREAILEEMNNILRGPNRDALTNEDVERLHHLKYKLKRLASNYNEDGTRKSEEGIKIAESIRAFNKATSEMSYWDITEENKTWFNTILQKKKDQLGGGLISQEDFDRWYRLNTQRVISQEFYEKRQVLLDTIASIMKKLPKGEFSEDIKKLWTEVFDIARPYRDEDNILDGTDTTTQEKTVIRSDEEKIEELKRKLIRFSGLNVKEEQQLGALWNSIESLTPDEVKEFAGLRQKKASYKKFIGDFLSDAEFQLLMDTFSQLAAIQTWMPTEYYNITYNQELHKFRMKIDPNLEENIDDVREAFESEGEWYKANHVLHFKKVFDEGQSYYTEVMEPLYIWKDIIPTDPTYIDQNAPGFSFRTRIVKDEFLNPEHSTDIKERLLPKKYLPDGSLSPYTNEKYESLKQESLSDSKAKAKWEMLQLLTQIHLGSQEGLPSWKRLGYMLPGVMKERYDRYLDTGVKGVAKDVKLAFTKTQDEKDLTLGDVSQLDLSIIPLKFSTAIKADDQNLNLAEIILKHKAATEEYQYLETELPLAKVISETLKTAKKDIPTNKINEVLGRLGFKRFIRADKESRRSRTFDEMIRTIFYGEAEGLFPQIIPGIDTNKIMANFLGLSSLQIMTLNIPAHITNIISGEIQNIIEASSKKYFTFKDYLKAKTIYGANIPNFWNDYSKEGGQSKWSAIAQFFDVPQGEFMDHIGRKTSFTRLRDFKSNLMIIKQTGEHEIQVTTLIAMMQNYKVKLDGQHVSLQDALEYKDKKIQIKPGAEITEKDLDRFQNKVHAVLRQLNGAYAKIDKTVAEKTLLGKLGFYMRKYFMPMAFRRWETFKYDYEEQDFKEGYYITTFRVIKDIMHLNADLTRNWDTYKKTLSADELANLRRMFSEIFIIGMIALTVMLIGGYDDDRKLKGRWWYTMGLYHLMRAKSEAETFLPGPGFNELTTLFSSPFAAASTVKTMGRLFSDTWNTVTFDAKDARFQRDYSIWKEGDLRMKADILKLTGINVNLITPENLVKNFELRQR